MENKNLNRFVCCPVQSAKLLTLHGALSPRYDWWESSFEQVHVSLRPQMTSTVFFYLFPIGPIGSPRAMARVLSLDETNDYLRAFGTYCSREGRRGDSTCIWRLWGGWLPWMLARKDRVTRAHKRTNLLGWTPVNHDWFSLWKKKVLLTTNSHIYVCTLLNCRCVSLRSIVQSNNVRKYRLHCLKCSGFGHMHLDSLVKKS